MHTIAFACVLISSRPFLYTYYDSNNSVSSCCSSFFVCRAIDDDLPEFSPSFTWLIVLQTSVDSSTFLCLFVYPLPPSSASFTVGRKTGPLRLRLSRFIERKKKCSVVNGIPSIVDISIVVRLARALAKRLPLIRQSRRSTAGQDRTGRATDRKNRLCWLQWKNTITNT